MAYYYIDATQEIADRVIAATGGMIDGRPIRHDGGKIGGQMNRSNYNTLARLVESAKYSGSTGATERQLAYLRELMLGDPGLASTVGITAARINGDLSKADASRLIDMFKSEA